jgi:hypothetical protein
LWELATPDLDLIKQGEQGSVTNIPKAAAEILLLIQKHRLAA